MLGSFSLAVVNANREARRVMRVRERIVMAEWNDVMLIGVCEGSQKVRGKEANDHVGRSWKSCLKFIRKGDRHFPTSPLWLQGPK